MTDAEGIRRAALNQAARDVGLDTLLELSALRALTEDQKACDRWLRTLV